MKIRSETIMKSWIDRIKIPWLSFIILIPLLMVSFLFTAEPVEAG